MAKRLTPSRFAHAVNHTVRNAITASQVSATLTTATFTLMATRSSELSGRTATKAGIDRSSDQSVGFENARPTGTASTIGVASVASSNCMVAAPSPRTAHDIGA